MTTRLVNRYRREPFDVCIMRHTSGGDRGGIYGNYAVRPTPQTMDPAMVRAHHVLDFARQFLHRMGLRRSTQWAHIPSPDPQYISAVLDLKDKIIACGCTPLLCHGDVYVHFLDGGLPRLDDYIRKLRRIVEHKQIPSTVWPLNKRCGYCRKRMAWSANGYWECRAHGRAPSYMIKVQQKRVPVDAPPLAKTNGVAIIIRRDGEASGMAPGVR